MSEWIEEQQRKDKEAAEERKRMEEEAQKSIEHMIDPKKKENMVVDVNDRDFFPEGPPDSKKTLKQLAEESQIEVFQTYLRLLRDPDTPAATKLAAANALADRGLGRPEQSVSQKVEVRRTDMDIHDAARSAAFAIRKAKEDGMLIDISPEIVDNVENKP